MTGGAHPVAGFPSTLRRFNGDTLGVAPLTVSTRIMIFVGDPILNHQLLLESCEGPRPTDNYSDVVWIVWKVKNGDAINMLILLLKSFESANRFETFFQRMCGYLEIEHTGTFFFQLGIGNSMFDIEGILKVFRFGRSSYTSHPWDMTCSPSFFQSSLFGRITPFRRILRKRGSLSSPAARINQHLAFINLRFSQDSMERF